MFIYIADQDERETLQQVFGSTVDNVTFWDADFPNEVEEPFELAQGFNAAGKLIGAKEPGDDGWEALSELIAERTHTVKFGLQL